MATVWKEEGQYALAVGAIDEAREAFRRYLVLRSKPDPELRAEVERVRRLFASGEAAP
jgi:hypothetical protein